MDRTNNSHYFFIGQESIVPGVLKVLFSIKYTTITQTITPISYLIRLAPPFQGGAIIIVNNFDQKLDANDSLCFYSDFLFNSPRPAFKAGQSALLITLTKNSTLTIHYVFILTYPSKGGLIPWYRWA